MTKKKVGIVTIQGRSNYGNRLQNFATSELIKEAGCLPVSLVLDRSDDFIARLRIFIKKITGKYRLPREEAMDPQRLAAFDRFNKLIEFETVTYSMIRSHLDCDLYCVGSDQIWRFGRFGFGEDWAYLQFANPERRIALAPSIGVDSITCFQSRRLSRYVRGYKCLSVRENRGAELIEEASGRRAEVLCDPTLAIDPAKWREVASNRLTPTVPYVFVYLLGSISDETAKLIDDLSRGGELPVVYLSDQDKNGEIPAGPSEFLSLIDCAQHVVTDSFHASLFSALFCTPLVIVRRASGNSAHANMFGRIETLADKLGINHMIYGGDQYDPTRSGDYRGVSEKIDQERKKFLGYLEACLNG